MHICEKCGRPFYMRDALRAHVCDAEKKEVKDTTKTRKELVAEAKELGIKGADRMDKESIMEAIIEA
jgi:predicted amino acid-binding ACT domain protein